MSHCARRYYMVGAEQGTNSAVAVPTREIYRGPNGDRWLLACDSDTARVFVRHEPNLPSGGNSPILRLEPFSSRRATPAPDWNVSQRSGCHEVLKVRSV